jgi:hypothetical protein
MTLGVQTALRTHRFEDGGMAVVPRPMLWFMPALRDHRLQLELEAGVEHRSNMLRQIENLGLLGLVWP